MDQSEERSQRIAEFRSRIDSAQGYSEVWEIVRDFEKSMHRYLAQDSSKLY